MLLRTKRLTLRPVTRDDHATLLAHWTSPPVRAFLFDGEVLSPEQVTRAIEETPHLWLIHDGEAPAGTVALRPLEDLGLEVVYSLEPGAWGKGYATEAARAVVDHALTTLGLPEVLAEVDEGNHASIRVVERLGMRPFETVEGLLGPMVRFRTLPINGERA